MPDRPQNAARPDAVLDPPAEMDVVNGFRPCKLPGIAERQPFLRVLLLPSVADDLAKEAVIVSDPVAAGGDPERCHALQETGGQAPEAAIAERCIRLRCAQPREIDAEISQRRIDDFAQSQISEHIVEQPADQKLERKIVDALAALSAARALRGEPAMGDAVAHRQGRGDEPVKVGRRCRILADSKRQLGEDGAFDFRDVVLVRCRIAADDGGALRAKLIGGGGRAGFIFLRPDHGGTISRGKEGNQIKPGRFFTAASWIY
jgi:hypothetical protein